MERDPSDTELFETDVERGDPADPGIEDDGGDEEAEREAVTSADDTGMIAQERALNRIPPQG